MWGLADENSRHRGVSAFEDEHPGTGHQPSPAEAGRDTDIIAKAPVLRAFSGSAGTPAGRGEPRREAPERPEAGLGAHRQRGLRRAREGACSATAGPRRSPAAA